MAEIKLTDDQRAELETIINNEGGRPGSSFHSWRCEDNVRYPEPCECVADVVDLLAEAIEKWMAPAPCVMKHAEPYDFAWCETPDAVPSRCRTYWGSHGCSLTRGHDGPHVCGCCEDPDGHAQRGPEHEEGIYCVGIPGYYGDTLTWTFFGEDA